MVVCEMSRLTTEDGRKNSCGIRIRALRNKKGISQEDLMDALQLLGFDSERGVIKRIEGGSRSVSDLELQLFARYFGVSYEYLIDGA